MAVYYGHQTITEEKTVTFLQSNLIAELDLSQLKQYQIDGLHKILERFDIYLDGNPINCSCSSHRMYAYLISKSKSERLNLDETESPDFSFYENNVRCVEPLEWRGAILSEYEYDKMCVPSLPQCPEACFCHHSWTLDDTIGNCTSPYKHVLKELPETFPENITNLYLSGNKITTLCTSRPYLERLQYLDLKFNSLQEICAIVLGDMHQLNNLYLSNNELTEIPRVITTLKMLWYIDVSSNPFRCDCDTFWMTEWILKPSLPENRNDIFCKSGQGQGKRVMDLQLDEVGCNEPLKQALIGLGITAVIVTVVFITVYRYRGYIKIWLSTRFRFHPWDNVEEKTEETDYDAFVSYCRKDVDWVLNTLLPKLEDPEHGFHLCVHDRDFVPGVAITKNIMTAIQYSIELFLFCHQILLNLGGVIWSFKLLTRGHWRTDLTS